MCVESWIHSVLWMQGPSLGQTLQDLSLSESRLLSALLTSPWLWAHVKIGINRYRCLIWAAVGLHGRAVSMELSSRQGLTDVSQCEITYRKVLYKRWSAIQIHQFMSETFPLTLVLFKILLNGKMPFKCYIFRSNKELNILTLRMDASAGTFSFIHLFSQQVYIKGWSLCIYFTCLVLSPSKFEMGYKYPKVQYKINNWVNRGKTLIRDGRDETVQKLFGAKYRFCEVLPCSFSL